MTCCAWCLLVTPRIKGEHGGALVVPAFAPDGSLQNLQCVTMGETAAPSAKGKKA